MKRLALVAALLLVSTPLSAAPPAKLARAIDAYLEPYIEHHVFSGVVLIGKGDDVVFAKGYGMANYEFAVPNSVDTRFGTASITKFFTSAILQKLVEDGKLSRSDVLAKWVPDFPSADKITIDHLAKHRSGIRDPEELRRIIRGNRTTAEVVDLLKKKPLASVPGETYSYTTANYAVLGHIIERITGHTFAQVIRDYVYTPAGMKDSGELDTTAVVPRLASGYMPSPFGDAFAVCGPEDTSWKTAGGSSYSTVRDLQRFVRAFYGGRLFAANPREVWNVSKSHDRNAAAASGAFPGANAFVLYFIDDGVTIAIMQNSYAPLASGIADDLAAIYFGETPRSSAAPKLVDKPLDPRILGSFQMDQVPGFPAFPPFAIVDRGGRAMMAWNSIRQAPLLPTETANTYFVPLDWSTITFAVDADGRINEATSTAAWSPQPIKMKRVP